MSRTATNDMENKKVVSKVGPLKILIKLTKYYDKIPDIEKKTEITKNEE